MLAIILGVLMLVYVSSLSWLYWIRVILTITDLPQTKCIMRVY